MFDIIACISTIEHIGLDSTVHYTTDPGKKEDSPEEYLPFIDVLRSLLKPGGRLYLTFPFGRAKNHGWFQVFDSDMVSAAVERFRPSCYSEEIFQYSGDRWRLSSHEEAKDATCFDPGVKKGNYDPDYAAFSRAVACLELAL
jgi:cyclopropane fatty-acyl-phospholipid synthase-like methyltransferase